MSKIKLGKTGVEVIKEWVIKTFLKQQPKGVLTTLPKKDFVDLNTAITAERLMRNGVDPNAIKNVNQVDNIIDELNKPRAVAADSPEGKGITEALFGKKGEVFNLQGEKLDPNLPIVGGTQQGKKINREFFEKDAAAQTDVNSFIQGIKSMEPIEAMKEANKVIKREGKYKNLTGNEAKKILQDTEDHIFERNVDIDPDDMFADGGRIGFFMGSKLPRGLATLREMLNFMGKKSDKVKNPSDVLKMVNPKSLNVSLEDPRLQGKVNKEGILASDMIKNFQSKMGEDRVQLVKDMLSAAKNIKKADASQIKFKNEMIEDMIKKGVDREMAEEMAITMSRLARNMAGKFTDTPKLTDEGILELENILKNMETGGKKKRDLNADGGRIGFKGGADAATESFTKSAGSSAKGKKGSVNVSPSGNVTFNPGGKDDPVDDRSSFEQTINQRNIVDKSKKPEESLFKNLYNVGQDFNYLRNLAIGNFPGIGKQLLFDLGKRKFLDNQVMLDQEGIINGLPENQFAELSETQLNFLNSPKIQRDLKEFGREPKAIFDQLPKYEERRPTLFNPLKKQEPTTPQEFNEYLDSIGVKRMTAADGGRIGFKKGMDRRTFMKAMAGLTTIPVFGKFFKGAEVAAPVVQKAAEVASGAPPYFFNLVNRIRALGKKFDGPKERTESYKYKDYEMQVDNDTGQIEIEKKQYGVFDDQEGLVSEEYMSFKPGQADETTGGKKVVDEYDEYTARADQDGKMKDVESGVSEETVMDGSISKEELEQEIIEQLSKEAPSIKKASGGIARMLGE